MKCQVDAIQVGGGGSSRIFPWSPKSGAIQWGGSTMEFSFVGPPPLNRPLELHYKFIDYQCTMKLIANSEQLLHKHVKIWMILIVSKRVKLLL